MDEIISDFALKDDNNEDIYDEIVKYAKNQLSSTSYISFSELCDKISKNFKISLSTTDVCAIENELINFCLIQWHDETIKFLKSYITTDKIDIITKLSEINNFNDIFKCNHEAFKSTNYLKYLIENKSIISDEREGRIINDVKLFVYSLIKQLESSLKLEFEFYEHFMNILLNSDEKLNEIIQKFQLRSVSSLRRLLNVVVNVNDEEYSGLKLIATGLLKYQSYKFENDIIKSIKDYVEPPTVNTVNKDNRWLIEVTAKHLIFSDVKEEIEKNLNSYSVIEEIRFVGCRVFCVNSSISNNLWHSKNIAIYAEKVKIVGNEIIWDVSGFNNTQNFSSKAITKSNGDGEIGEDGRAGESGGNVAVITSDFVNSSSWTIKSFGGKGSNGQDGGNGDDGSDGDGMRVSEFKDYIGSKKRCRNYWNGETVSISSNGGGVNGEWHLEFELPSGKRITEIVDKGYYLLYCYVHQLDLVKGTSGKPGSDGGVGGFGGEGGYAGQIEIYSSYSFARKSIENGRNGENGQNGLNGVRGTDGHDVGHYTTVTEPHSYYGENANSKYKLDWYSNRDGNRVCSYRYRDDTYRYAEITYNGRVETKRAKFERNTQRNARERSARAKAVKNKTINPELLRNTYKNLFKNPIDKNIKALKIDENELVKLRKRNEEEMESEIKETTKHRRIFMANARNRFKKRNIKVESEAKVDKKFDVKNFPKELKEAVKYLKSYEISSLKDIHVIRKLLNNDKSENFLHVDSLEQMRFKNFQLTVISNFFKYFSSDHSKFLEGREFLMIFDRKLKVFTQSFELSIKKSPKLVKLYKNSQKYHWMMEELENCLEDDKKLKFSMVLYKNLKQHSEKIQDIENYLSNPSILNDFTKFITVNLPIISIQLFSDIRLQIYGLKVLIEKQKYLELAKVFGEIENKSRNYHLRQNFKENHSNETKKFHPQCFKVVKFQDDKTQHGKLGRLSQYFVNDSTKTRDQIKEVVEEFFKTFVDELSKIEVKLNPESENTSKRHRFKMFFADKWKKFKGGKDLDTSELQYINRLFKSSILRFLKEIENQKREVDDDIQDMIEINKEIQRISKLKNKNFHFESWNNENFYFEDWINQNSSDNEIYSKISNFRQHFINTMTDKLVIKALNLKSFRTEYLRNIKYNGTKSASCVELLAHIFEVNLQVFDLQELKVKENFNEKDEKVIYLRERNGFYEKIVIDEQFCQLCDKQDKNSEIFQRIFRDFGKLKTLNDLREYVDGKEYLKYIGNDEDWSETDSESDEDEDCKEEIYDSEDFEDISDSEEHSDNKSKPMKYKCEFDEVLHAIYPKKGKLDDYKSELRRKFIPKMMKMKRNKILSVRSCKSSENLHKLDSNSAKDNKKLPINSDHFLIHSILNYFNYDSMKDQLFGRLQLISSCVLKSSDILQTIATKFHIDGVYMTADELIVSIDMILNHFQLNNSFPTNCLMIVALETQENWLLKLLLMRIETFLRKQISSEKFLTNLKKTNRKVLILLAQKLLCSNETSSEGNLLEITKLLQYATANSVDQLKDLKLNSWKYFGIQEYYKHQLNKLNFTEQQREKLQFYLVQMQCIFGSEIIVEFIDMLVWKKSNLNDGDEMIEIFQNFYNNRWQLNSSTVNILREKPASRWFEILDDLFACNECERSISDIIKIVKFSSLISDEVKRKLNLFEREINSLYGSKYLKYSRQEIINWVALCHLYKQFNLFLSLINVKYIEPTNIELLAVITRTIMIATNEKVKLRPTQLFALLVMIESNTNMMAQISTGEGKSWIAVAFAIMKVFKNENIDIITSNKVLAERDATKPEIIDTFSMFNIKIGHNCDENESVRRQVYSSSNVVYGDLPNFQRDYLLETFYGRNIFGDRRFQNVLIDEVDSMLLDKGNNILYLSHNLPYMDELKPLYIYITQFITQKVANEEQLKYIWNKNVIKRAVYREFFKMIDKSEFREYFIELDDWKVNKLWHILIDKKIINDKGFLLNGKLNQNCRNELENSFLQKHIDRLKFLLLKYDLKKSDYIIPSYLHSFVLLHIEKLIENALRAVQMINKREFIVDVDKSGVSSDVHPAIIIQDLDTGSDLWNSEFDEGLNQFLQLNHGCKLTEQSLKAVFISNVSYFKIYSRIFGMTGTLGTANERDKLNKIHDTDFVVIPQYKTRKFVEDDPKLLSNYDEWIEFIATEVKKKREKEKRSILIICETIHDVEKIKEKLAISKENLIIYDRSFDKPEIDNLTNNKVVIATNIAGRGTDITITDYLADCGGLHVIITFLPNNIRIEQQAFGRAARCGMRGSGRLIINCSNYDSVTNLLELKQIRDENELKRIDQVCEFYENTIKFEESLFASFKNAFSRYKIDDSESFVSQIPLIGSTIENLLPEDTEKKEKNKFIEILRKSFLDSWALWLDKNNDEITRNDKPSEKLEELLESLNDISSDYQRLTEDNIPHWIKSKNVSPVAMVNFIKLLAEKKKKNDMKSINREAVERHSDDLASIYMNCFTKSKELSSLKNFHSHDCVLETLIAFEKRRDREFFYYMMIKNLQSRNNENVTEIKAAKEQFEANNKVLDIFIDSLMQIRGYNITPDSFTDILSNNPLIAEKVFDDLLKNDLLTKPTIQVRDFMKPYCDEIAAEYCIESKKLWNFLNDRRNFTYQNFDAIEDVLECKISLPSAEKFWKILKENKKIIDIEVIVTIDRDRLESFDKGLYNKISELDHEKSFDGKLNGKISLYSVITKDEKSKKNDEETKIDFFEKNLLKHITSDQYKDLKMKKIVTFNEIATLTKTKIEFSKYSKFSKSDLDILQIPDDDLDEILKILVNSKVLLKINDGFSLNFNIYSNDDDSIIKLDKYEFYSAHVRQFLNIFCCYPIALKKLEKQMFDSIEITDEKLAMCVKNNSKDFTPFVSLPSRPHRRLMNDLMNNHFIEQPKLNHDKYDDIESEINHLYQTSYLPHDFVFSLLNLFIKWIQNPAQFPNLLINLNTLTFSSQQSILNEKCEEISNVLKSSASTIKLKEEPETGLRSLTEYFKENEITNETNAFITKGLDSLITVDEKKWTPKVIFGFIFVIIAGIIQFTIGTIMMISSMGLAYHIASGIMQEGISDLFFAFSVYRSGHFTWKDYFNHKWQSICFTVACCGISYFFSNAMSSTVLGQKIFGPGVVKNGTELSKLTGWALLREVGARQVLGVFFRSAIKQGIKIGIRQGLQYAYRALLERRLKGLIDGLVQGIQTGVYKKISESSLNKKFTELYTKVGSKKASKIIERSITEALKKNPAKELYKILDGVMTINDHFLSVCSKNPNEMNNEILDAVKMMSIMLKLYESSVIFLEIATFSGQIIKDIDENLSKEMKDLRQERSIQENEKLEVFLNNSVTKVEKKINDHTSKVINDKIITPLANLFLNKLAHQIESRGTKFIQKSWNDRKERKIRDKVIKTIDDIQNLNENDPNQRMEVKVLKENLVNLMQKTKSPETVAMILRQKVPMNLLAVKASLPIINQAIRQLGGVRVKITMGDYTYEIGEGSRLVAIDLNDGHFGEGSSDDNDCYFEELCNQIPELNNMTADIFRSRIADVIESDPGMRKEVEQGWHNYSMGIGFVGGAKKEVPKTDLNPKQIKECEEFFKDNRTYDFDGNKDSHMKYKFKEKYGEGILNDFKKQNIQRIMAQRKALEFINKDLLEKKLIDSPITFADMKATCYSKIMVYQRYGPDHGEGRVEGAYYPVEMEFIAKDGSRYEINMDNPRKADTYNGPEIPHIGYSIPGDRSSTIGHVFFESSGNEPTRMKNASRFAKTTLDYGDRFVPMENFDNFTPNIDLRMHDDNFHKVDFRRLPMFQAHKLFRDFRP